MKNNLYKIKDNLRLGKSSGGLTRPVMCELRMAPTTMRTILRLPDCYATTCHATFTRPPYHARSIDDWLGFNLCNL